LAGRRWTVTENADSGWFNPDDGPRPFDALDDTDDVERLGGVQPETAHGAGLC
jgi:hypothetical protein